MFGRTPAALTLHAMNLAFAKIPLGVHTIWACLAASVVALMLSFLLRLGVSTILPFEVIIVGVLGIIVLDILYGMIKFIPVEDKRTGQTKRWAIGTLFSLISDEQLIFNSSHFCNSTTPNTGTWLHMPASHRFDLKARAAVKRNIQTTYVIIDFSFNVNIFFHHTFVLSMTDNLPSPSVSRILSLVVSSFNPLL